MKKTSKNEPSLLKICIAAFVTLIIFLWIMPHQKVFVVTDKHFVYNNAPIPSEITTQKVDDTIKGNRNYIGNILFNDSVLFFQKPLKGYFTVELRRGSTWIHKDFGHGTDTLTKEDSINLKRHEEILKSGKMMPTFHFSWEPLRDTVLLKPTVPKFLSTNYVEQLHVQSGDAKLYGPDNFSLNIKSYVYGDVISYADLNFHRSDLSMSGKSLVSLSNVSLRDSCVANLNGKQASITFGLIYQSSLTCLAKEINFYGTEFSSGSKIVLDGRDTGSINIDKSKFSGSKINLLHAKTIIKNVKVDSITDIVVRNPLRLDSIYGPGKIRLIGKIDSNRTVTVDNKLIDAEFFIKVTLRNIDTGSIVFPDQGIHFIIDENQGFQRQLSLYNFLIRRYSNNPEEKQLYDIAYQKLLDKKNDRWFVGFVKENWNNYGYDRNLIFRNSFLLMLMFFAINLFIFPTMLYKGYWIKEFDIAQHQIATSNGKQWLIDLKVSLNCFLYTFFIFWGLKLSLDNIKIGNVGYSLLIIIEYVTGIICLAHIANIVITR